MKYIGIVGSRKRSQKYTIRCILRKFQSEYPITLVSGGAKGIDTEAEQVADKLGIPKIIYRPNYVEYAQKGNDIYFERNEKIANKSDILFAFPLNMKGGTLNTINFFRAKHNNDKTTLQYRLFIYNGLS